MPVVRSTMTGGFTRSHRVEPSAPTKRGDDMLPMLRGAAGIREGVRDPDLVQEFACALFLLGAVAAAAFAQGGFFARGQLAATALLAAAVVAALPLRRSASPELRAPLAAGGLLAAWMVIRAVPGGSPAAAIRAALLLLGLATVIVLCRRLDRSGKRLVLAGLLGVGVFVSLVGWAGVVWRLEPWALPSEGLWRAASTLTYANATSAVLVPLLLVALALLSRRPRSLPLALVLAVLLTGVAATLSRAAALALLVGLGVLLLAGGWVVLRALVVPLIGATVAFLGLVPSLPASAEPRPGVAVAALVGGMGITAALVRRRGSGRTALVLALLLAAVLVVGSGSIREAGLRVWDGRANLDSPNRSRGALEALRVAAEHPVTGVGTGSVVVQTTDRRGRLQVQQYIHNEYLQLLAELGAIGAVLLAALLAGVARLLWRSRPLGSATALWAGVLAACAAAAVHAGFDFVWHVPAVPLTLAVLIGLVVGPATREDRVA